MQPEPLIALVSVIALVWILTWLGGQRDRARIKEAVSAQGGVVQTIRRKLFYRIMSSGRTAYYQVGYADAKGRRHEGVCSTNIWVGVRWLSDIITDYGNAPVDAIDGSDDNGTDEPRP